MKRIVATEKVPIEMWVDDLAYITQAQIYRLANAPYEKGKIVALPNISTGLGVPNGTVTATTDVIIPNAIGADIGAGVIAIKVELDGVTGVKLTKLRDLIKGKVQFSRNVVPCDDKDMPVLPLRFKTERFIVNFNHGTAKREFGTVEGHDFIGIYKDVHGSDKDHWIIVRSGSRSTGLAVSQWYNSRAQKLNDMFYSGTPAKYNFPFLPMDTVDGRRYMVEQTWCRAYAKANRKEVAMRIAGEIKSIWSEAVFGEPIDSAYNSIKVETYSKRNYVIHRKEAYAVSEKEKCVVIGGLGDKSFICSGREDNKAYNSCAANAGFQARIAWGENNESLKLITKKLEGVIYEMKLNHNKDVYLPKDIEGVMAEQLPDLIRKEAELAPVLIMKDNSNLI